MANRRKGSLGKRKASMDLELDRVLNAEVSRMELLRLRQSCTLLDGAGIDVLLHGPCRPQAIQQMRLRPHTLKQIALQT